MKALNEIRGSKGLLIIAEGIDGGAGQIFFTGNKKPAGVVWSNGGGWEHVSVSFPNRCPTWEEMCIVKEMFWRDEETVVQYHPKKSEYVNLHPYCLHLWKKIGVEYELPNNKMI